MPFYIGENKIVDRYIGDKLVIAAYKGETKYFDAYSEITGSLPIIFKSRAAVALKNYLLHGTSEGAGVQTENLFDKNAVAIGKYIDANGIEHDSTLDFTIRSNHSDYMPILENTPYTFYGHHRTMSNHATVSMSWYDESKQFMSRTTTQIIAAGAANYSFSMTSPQNTRYVIVTFFTDNFDTVMFTEASTAPTTYIPFGYKIPLTNTGENLFDYTARDTEKGFISGARLKSDGTYDPVINWCISEYIAANESSNYVWRWTDVTEPLQAGASVGFYDNAKTFISGIAYNRRGVVPFTTPANTKYIRVSFLLSEGTTLLNCVLVRGSTAPTSYIPYRSSTYPLYIGSTKLGEEEYLDYEEQKVHKRGENVGDWNKATGYNATITSVQNGVTIRSSTGSGSYPSVNFTTQVAGTVDSLGLTAGVTYLVTFNVSDVSTPSADTAKKRFCLRDSANTVVKSDTQALTAEGEHTFTFTFQSGHYLSFLLARSSASQSTSLTITDLKITEFQPTDPPAPLPAINTYKGENTLSSTEPLGEVTIKGRINELPTQQPDN